MTSLCIVETLTKSYVSGKVTKEHWWKWLEWWSAHLAYDLKIDGRWEFKPPVVSLSKMLSSYYWLVPGNRLGRVFSQYGWCGQKYLCFLMFFFYFDRIYAKRVYELNTRARKTRLQTSVSMVEQTVVPVVKSKVTEVRGLIPTKLLKFYWHVIF